MAVRPYQFANLRVICGDNYSNGKPLLVFPFESNMIKMNVPDSIERGNYRIGVIDDGVFKVKYVGRTTDQNLQKRMLQHKNRGDDHYYNDNHYFFYSIAQTDEDAIRQECVDFHSFGGDDILDNTAHPALPNGVACVFDGCYHVGGE